MSTKFGLMALSAMATLVLVSGASVSAKSEETDTKKVEKPETVIVTVKEGDTLDAIAKDNKTSYVRLFNANEKIISPDLIYAGDKVRIPEDDEKLDDRFSDLTAAVQAEMVAADAYASQPATAPVATTTTTTTPQYAYQGSARGSSIGNTYGAGWCTWYAKNMRPDLPNNLGDAGSWAANAAAQGIPTGSAPRVGAIAVTGGHVAYVTGVSGNNVTISESGWNYTPYNYNTRTVPASSFYSYIYK